MSLYVSCLGTDRHSFTWAKLSAIKFYPKKCVKFNKNIFTTKYTTQQKKFKIESNSILNPIFHNTKHKIATLNVFTIKQHMFSAKYLPKLWCLHCSQYLKTLVTGDTWHVTHDTWCGVNILSKFQLSLALLVWLWE